MFEDQILSLGTLILNLTLLTTLRDEKSKLSRFTSIPTTIILLLFAATYYSMNLVFSSLSVFVGGVMWSLIAVYRS